MSKLLRNIIKRIPIIEAMKIKKRKRKKLRFKRN